MQGVRTGNENEDGGVVQALHEQPSAGRPCASVVQCARGKQRRQGRDIHRAGCFSLPSGRSVPICMTGLCHLIYIKLHQHLLALAVQAFAGVHNADSSGFPE